MPTPVNDLARRYSKWLAVLVSPTKYVHLTFIPFVSDFILIILTACQVFKVTCDNARNNDTMMVEFASHIEKATGRSYDATGNRIRYVYITTFSRMCC